MGRHLPGRMRLEHFWLSYDTVGKFDIFSFGIDIELYKILVFMILLFWRGIC